MVRNSRTRRPLSKKETGSTWILLSPCSTPSTLFTTLAASLFSTGFVTSPFSVTVLKSDAANVVKRVEGVEHVDNKIQVLPVSFFDNGLRARLYRTIYGYGPLQRYALGVSKPIRIIVENGHVTLMGVVVSEMDKNLAGLRANN